MVLKTKLIEYKVEDYFCIYVPAIAEKHYADTLIEAKLAFYACYPIIFDTYRKEKILKKLMLNWGWEIKNSKFTAPYISDDKAIELTYQMLEDVDRSTIKILNVYTTKIVVPLYGTIYE